MLNSAYATSFAASNAGANDTFYVLSFESLRRDDV